MSRKIRLIILTILGVFFLVSSFFLISYSYGYRFDFEKKRMVKTGGLSLKISPSGALVYLNDKLVGKNTPLFNSVFIQNLLPKNYKVTVKKEGYFPWEKFLEVKEQEVTKAENIILFPEEISFSLAKEKIEDFFPPSKEEEPPKILKNLVAFTILNHNIFWLSEEGILIKSDSKGKILEVLNKKPYQVKEKEYEIKVLPKETIFLCEDKNLFYLNKEKGVFEEFFNNFNGFKISPDSQKILIFSDYEIWLSNLKGERVFLNRFSEKIKDCFWLNPYYLIFNTENKIKIIEVDNRDKLNLYELKVKLDEKEASEMENPKIFFDQTNKKLYLQIKENLYSSEPLF